MNTNKETYRYFHGHVVALTLGVAFAEEYAIAPASPEKKMDKMEEKAVKKEEMAPMAPATPMAPVGK